MRNPKSEKELFTKIKRVQQIHEDVGVRLEEIELLLARRGIGGAAQVPSVPVSIEPPGHLEMSFDACGDATVRVDNFVPFALSCVPAALLYILSEDTGDSGGKDDILVPFKEFDAITARMAMRLGRRRYTEGAMKTAICRLRKILATKGFGGLVETDKPRRAYRFAILRTTTPDPEALSVDKPAPPRQAAAPSSRRPGLAALRR
jgi:hypothetical protein